MSPERQAAAAVDSAATVDDVRLPITGTEAVEAIAGAGLVIVPAERMVAHPAPDLDALEAAARRAGIEAAARACDEWAHLVLTSTDGPRRLRHDAAKSCAAAIRALLTEEGA